MQIRQILLGLVLFLLVGGCTPKVTEEAQSTEETTVTAPTPEPEEEDLSPCPKFRDAPNPDEAETNYVLYRDFIKVKQWEKAFELWQKVHEVAPAADGRRNTVYADGIRFYERFLSETTDEAKKNEYIDKIFQLYDEIDECYSEGGYIVGRKAFDLYYKYPDRATKDEIFAMFKETIDTDGMDAPDFVINPFTTMLVNQYFEGKIPMGEAQEYTEKIKSIVANGVENCEGRACERWKIIEGYAPLRLEAFETERGFYDCDYYLSKYFAEFEEAKEDCDVIRTVYSRLKWGNCSEADAKFQELIAQGNAICVEPDALKLAYEALRNAEYTKAVELFNEAAENEEDPEKKAKIVLIVAKIYNAHLKDFPTSRKYALQAAEIRPNWGEPYILIGRLYASSGPLCGPGRGWDSQIVTWPAIDMWNKAKRVDSSVAAEANKWIGRYSQYMPNKEDVFIRNLKAGDTFYVGCWIQETTRIRTSD